MLCFSLTRVSREFHLIQKRKKVNTFLLALFPYRCTCQTVIHVINSGLPFWRLASRPHTINSRTRKALQYFISGQQKVVGFGFFFSQVDGSTSVVTRVGGHSFVLIQWLITADEFRESDTTYSEQGSILSTALNLGFLYLSRLASNLASQVYMILTFSLPIVMEVITEKKQMM